jgi:hypothetical protein
MVSLLAATAAWAQPYLFFGPRSEYPQFGVRFLHPKLDEDLELKTLTGTYDFGFAFPLSPSLNLVGMVPLVKVAIENQDSSGFGNVYVGVQTREPEAESRLTSASFGVFLPTASRDDSGTLQLGAGFNVHDFAKYVPDYLTVVMTPSYQQRIGASGVLGLEVGPQVLIPTGGEGNDVEIFLQYGAAAGLQRETVSLLVEVIGLYTMTFSEVSAGDRFYHSLQGKVATQIGLFRPSLFYRLPLDDNQKDFLDSSLGLQLEVTFR